MAVTIIIICMCFVAWFDVIVVRAMLPKGSLAEAGYLAPNDLPIEDLLSNAASEITAMLDLRACWFEPFPFDVQMPRIEHDRIVLPPPEPGVAPWSDTGVELPVRANGLSVGRFVLEPTAASVGAVFSPRARQRAVAMADQLGGHVAVVLISGESSRLRASRSSHL